MYGPRGRDAHRRKRLKTVLLIGKDTSSTLWDACLISGVYETDPGAKSFKVLASVLMIAVEFFWWVSTHRKF